MIYEAEKKTALLGRGFSYFYAAINVGSALTSLGLPLVRDAYGTATALAVPAGLMAVSFALFVAGRRHDPVDPLRRGRAVPDTRKMRYGFWIVVVTMAGMAAAGASAAFGKVSAWWLLLATFVITLAELCISVVGLELSYRRALPGTKSAVTGAFLATTFVGDLFGGMFAQLYGRISPGAYFLVQAAIAAAAALAFGWVAHGDDRAPGRPAAMSASEPRPHPAAAPQGG